MNTLLGSSRKRAASSSRVIAGTLAVALAGAGTLGCSAGPVIDASMGAVNASGTAGMSSGGVAGGTSPLAGANGISVAGTTAAAGATSNGGARAGEAGMGGAPTAGAANGVGGMAGAAGGAASGGAGMGGATSAGGGNGSACEPFVMPADCTVPENAVLPSELRCTGLYQNWETRELACGLREYAPAYALWSDGLGKTRYVWIPPGETIDVTAPDDFRYPIGTQFWKEFRVTGADGEHLAETRLMRRVAAGWLYTSYVWTADGTNAIQNNDGVEDLYGTGHTVPTRDQCKDCHSGRPDFILGWDALMLGTGATGLTRDVLVSEGLVTWDGKDTGAPSPLDLEVPGDDVERAALGYLHANCGASCHNGTSNALALETGFFMRLEADTLGDVQDTLVLTTGIERTQNPNAPLSGLPPAPAGAGYVDLRPLDVESSLVVVRMRLRGEDAAMPLLGTNVVDDAGVAIIEQWIEQMTPERGYGVSPSTE